MHQSYTRPLMKIRLTSGSIIQQKLRQLIGVIPSESWNLWCCCLNVKVKSLISFIKRKIIQKSPKNVCLSGDSIDILDLFRYYIIVVCPNIFLIYQDNAKQNKCVQIYCRSEILLFISFHNRCLISIIVVLTETIPNDVAGWHTETSGELWYRQIAFSLLLTLP